MSATHRLQASFALLLIAAQVACGDDDAAAGVDPKAATCESKVVMSCVQTPIGSTYTCKEFYSDVAADAVRDACVAAGATVQSGPCGASYELCCIDLDGSNDYPEGSCISTSNPDHYNQWYSSCVSSKETICKK